MASGLEEVIDVSGRELSADELIKNTSRQLGVPEDLLRSVVQREGIDPVAFWQEKRMAMEWKRAHGHRLALGGRLAAAEVPFEVRQGGGQA